MWPTVKNEGIENTFKLYRTKWMKYQISRLNLILRPRFFKGRTSNPSIPVDSEVKLYLKEIFLDRKLIEKTFPKNPFNYLDNESKRFSIMTLNKNPNQQTTHIPHHENQICLICCGKINLDNSQLTPTSTQTISSQLYPILERFNLLSECNCIEIVNYLINFIYPFYRNSPQSSSITNFTLREYPQMLNSTKIDGNLSRKTSDSSIEYLQYNHLKRIAKRKTTDNTHKIRKILTKCYGEYDKKNKRTTLNFLDDYAKYYQNSAISHQFHTHPYGDEPHHPLGPCWYEGLLDKRNSKKNRTSSVTAIPRHIRKNLRKVRQVRNSCDFNRGIGLLDPPKINVNLLNQVTQLLVLQQLKLPFAQQLLTNQINSRQNPPPKEPAVPEPPQIKDVDFDTLLDSYNKNNMNR
ncbi:hypothetical protein SNEBB_003768 [Seison nebaliae]|nr:hypothetical protein SNEBB_003768 [Seison nebaliae]